MLALMVFSVWLGWFPVGFSAPHRRLLGERHAGSTRIHHAALPALVLSLTGVANVALHTREKTVDVMASEYMRFAEARGETRRRAVLRHGLRNLALPALTLQFTSVSEIVGGSVLVEQVFSYPGLGQAAVTAGLGDAHAARGHRAGHLGSSCSRVISRRTCCTGRSTRA